MKYPDAIRITRPTNTGSLNEFGAPASVGSTLLYGDACDVQDVTYEAAIEITGDRNPGAISRVFLRDSTNVLTLATDDDCAVTRGSTGAAQTGRILRRDPFNVLVFVRWT